MEVNGWFTPRPLYPRGNTSCIHRLGGWAKPTASLHILENREMSYAYRELKSGSFIVSMMLKQMVYRLQLFSKGLKTIYLH